MVSKNIFICFAKSPVLLTLTVFVFAYNCAIVWGAESLRLGFSGATATQLAGSIAVEQKLFDLYGVNVELTQSAGTTMISALDSGSLDVAIVGGGQALSAYLKGVDVRIIGGLVNKVPYELWAKPEIAQLKDLKGKLIANTPPGTSLNLGTSVLLLRAGLDPSRDVKLIAFGRIQLVSRALLGGVVDAALLSPPDTIEAKKSGMRMVVDLSSLDASRWINLTGASGHTFGPHYTDQFELWRTGKTLPMRWDPTTVRREAENTLTLRPSG